MSMNALETIAEYKFFKAVRMELLPNCKTNIFLLISRSTGKEIGRITFYAHWRQFAFQPWPSTFWSAGCLEDVMDALGKIKADYKAERAK